MKHANHARARNCFREETRRAERLLPCGRRVSSREAISTRAHVDRWFYHPYENKGLLAVKQTVKCVFPFFKRTASESPKFCSHDLNRTTANSNFFPLNSHTSELFCRGQCEITGYGYYIKEKLNNLTGADLGRGRGGRGGVARGPRLPFFLYF